MNHSPVWKFVLSGFVLIGICGLLTSGTGAQAPAASTFPTTITTSS